MHTGILSNMEHKYISTFLIYNLGDTLLNVLPLPWYCCLEISGHCSSAHEFNQGNLVPVLLSHINRSIP